MRFRIITSCLVLIVLSGLSFSTDQTKGIKFFNGSLNQIGKLAKVSKKPIFIYVGAPYCKISQKMERIISKQNVADYYNSHFTSIRMDPSNYATNFRLTNWGITTVPSFIYMDLGKRIIKKTTGFRDEATLMNEAETALRIIQSDVKNDSRMSQNTILGNSR